MPWVRLDEQFPEHPKVVAVGPLAGWLHVCALAYCNRNLTDGFVPTGQVNRLASYDGIANGSTDVEPLTLAGQLVNEGMWKKVPGGFVIHDFHDYQPSKADVEAQREAKREAGRKGGLARAARLSSTQANGQANAKQNPSSHAAPAARSSTHNRPVDNPPTGAATDSVEPGPFDHPSSTVQAERQAESKQTASTCSSKRLAESKPDPDTDTDPLSSSVSSSSDLQRARHAAEVLRRRKGGDKSAGWITAVTHDIATRPGFHADLVMLLATQELNNDQVALALAHRHDTGAWPGFVTPPPPPTPDAHLRIVPPAHMTEGIAL